MPSYYQILVANIETNKQILNEDTNTENKEPNDKLINKNEKIFQSSSSWDEFIKFQWPWTL